MFKGSSDFKKQRKKMVEKQLKRRGIADQAVLDAFLEVPRHSFVPDDMKKYAYQDRPLPIGEGQTISQPYIVALMLEALELKAEDSVLEIGTGCGYVCALLSRIVEQVYGIERLEKLAEKTRENCQELRFDNIEVKAGDGTKGWPEKAPFAGIIVSAAAPDIPDSLVEQLNEGGIMVIPTGEKHVQRLEKIENRDGELHRENLSMVRFVSLIGEEGW